MALLAREHVHTQAKLLPAAGRLSMASLEAGPLPGLGRVSFAGEQAAAQNDNCVAHAVRAGTESVWPLPAGRR